MTRITLFSLLVLLTVTACSLQAESTAFTPTPPPTDSPIGAITINPGLPTALPTPDNTLELTPSGNMDGVICRVRNGNQISNVAVRRAPNTSAELFYAIQPTYTASVLEIQQVAGSVPWYYVRVDNPIETDLEVVEGWLRSDTVVPMTLCR